MAEISPAKALKDRFFNAYLDLLEVPAAIEVNLQSLRKLHRQHLYRVPFENLSMYYGPPIDLKPSKLLEKLIQHKRGGFCYELNFAFYHLLAFLGLEARLLACRCFNKQGDLNPEFDHLALEVDLEGSTYLCDVGFGGDSFIEPLPLVPDVPSLSGTEFYKIEKEDEHRYWVHRSLDGKHFEKLYTFSRETYDINDFKGMCLYHQTHPESWFLHKKFIAQYHPGGRKILSDQKFKSRDGVSTYDEVPIENEATFLLYLKEHFNIHLSPIH